MKKNIKRWLAFLLAVALVVTSVVYSSSDGFLWATSGDEAQTAEQPENANDPYVIPLPSESEDGAQTGDPVQEESQEAVDPDDSTQEAVNPADGDESEAEGEDVSQPEEGSEVENGDGSETSSEVESQPVENPVETPAPSGEEDVEGEENTEAPGLEENEATEGEPTTLEGEQEVAVSAVTTASVTVVKKDTGVSELYEISLGVIEENLPVIEGYDFVDARYSNASIQEIYAVQDGEQITYFVSGESNALTGIEVDNTTNIILNYKPHVENYKITYEVTLDGQVLDNISGILELIGVQDVDAGEAFEFSAKPNFGYEVEKVTAQIGEASLQLVGNASGLYTVSGDDVTTDVTVVVAIKEIKQYAFKFVDSSNTTLKFDGTTYSSQKGNQTGSYSVGRSISFTLEPNGQHDEDKKELNKLVITLAGETIAVTPPANAGDTSSKLFLNGTEVRITKTSQTNKYGSKYEVEIVGPNAGNLHGDIEVSVNFKNAANSEIWPQDLIGVEPIGVAKVTTKTTGWPWNPTTTEQEEGFKKLDPTQHQFTGRDEDYVYRVYIKVKDGYSTEKGDITVSVTTDGQKYPINELKDSTKRADYDYYFEIPANGGNFKPLDIRISVEAKKIEKNFKVTYNYNNGDNSVTDAKVYKSGDNFAVTDGIGAYPKKEGYVFQGWEINGKLYKPGAVYTINSTTENLAVKDADGNYVYTFTAKWVKSDQAESVPFIVNVFFADEDGNYATTPDVFFQEFGPAGKSAYIVPTKLRAMLEAQADQLPENWREYIEDESKTVKSTIIALDGSTVVSIFYHKPLYKVTFDRGEHGVFVGSDEQQIVHSGLKKGVDFPKEPEIVADTGYVFMGWEPKLPAQVTEKDGVYVAQYKKFYVVNVTAKYLTTTYDGTEKSVSGFEGETEKGIPVEADGQTYYVTGLKSEAKGTGVSDSQKSIVVDKTNMAVVDADGNDVSKQFDVNVKEGYLEIQPVTLTITKSESKPYTGNDQTMTFTDADITSGGIAAGEELVLNASITGKDVDSYSYERAEGDARVIKTVEGKEVDVTENYRIDISGTLIITAVKFNGSVSLDDWTYGEAPAVEVAQIEGGDYLDPVYYYKVLNADDSTYTDVKPEDAGEYTVAAVWSATGNSQKTWATDDFTIKRRSVTVYQEDERQYTGKEQTLSLNADNLSVIAGTYAANDSLSEVTGASISGTNVADYTDVVWAEGENYRIVKKDSEGNIIKDVTSNYQLDVTGKLSIVKANSVENASVFEGDVELADWYYGDTKPAEVSSVTGLNGAVADYLPPVYLYRKAGESEFRDEVPTEAGHYEVKAVWAETDNCKELTATYEFEIMKRNVTVSATGNASYTGSEQSLTITAENAEVVQKEDEGYGFVNGDQIAEINGAVISGTNAGTYRDVSADYTCVVMTSDGLMDVSHNYNVIVEGEFIIGRGTATGTVALENWTYGDTAKIPEANVSLNVYGEPRYYYKAADAGEAAYTETVPTNAGDYVVKAVWEAPDDNYATVEATSNFTILKREINVYKESKVTYNGADQPLTITAEDITGSVKLAEGDNLVLTNAVIHGTDAGEYAYNEEEANHSWQVMKGDEDVSDNYTVRVNGKLVIDKKAVTVYLEDTKTYTGNRQELKLDNIYTSADEVVNGLVDGDRLELNNALIPGTEVGVYVEIENPAKIFWSVKKSQGETVQDVSGNYDVTVAGKLEIIKAEADSFDAEVSLDNWTYGDTAALEISSIKGTGDIVETLPVYMYKEAGAADDAYTTTKPVNAGSYVVKAVWAATNNCEEVTATATFNIWKRSLTINASDVKNYTGSEQTLDITTLDDLDAYSGLANGDRLANIAVTGVAKGMNVGTYTGIATNSVVISILNGNGEEVKDNYEVTVNGTLEIVKAETGSFEAKVELGDWTYGNTAATEISSITGIGNTVSDHVVPPVYMYKEAGAADGTYTTTKPVNAGSYVVKAIWEATSNCEEVSAEDTFTIERRPVTITAGSASKTFDREPLTTDKAEAEGLVEGHTLAQVTVNGEQIWVGSSKSSVVGTSVVIEDINGQNVTINYQVTTIKGDLTVTDVDVDPALVMTKSHDTNKTYNIGDKVEFEISVTNIYDSLMAVTLAEKANVIFADGILNMQTLSIPKGETATVKAYYTIREDDIVAGMFENTVTGTFVWNNVVKQYTAKDTVITADVDGHLEVTKTADDPDRKYKLGEEISYTITVENVGNVTWKDITVTDKLTGDTFQIEELAPGAPSQSFKVTYTVTEMDILKGHVLNRATATGTTPDVDPTVDPDEETVDTEEPRKELWLKKDVVDRAANEPYKLGDTVEFIIKAENTGNLTLTDVVVEDELTGNTQANNKAFVIDTIAPGEEVIVGTVSYVVTEQDIMNDRVHNVATVPGDPDYVIPGQVSAVVENENPSLFLEKTADKMTNAALGEEITYTIRLVNNGNVTIENIAVEDELTGHVLKADGTDNRLKPKNGTLAPGESETFTVTYTVTEADILAGSIVNTATVSGDNTDPNVPDPEVKDEDEVETKTEPIDTTYNVTKTVLEPKDEYNVNDVIQYQIIVSSEANVTLHNVVVTDQLQNAAGEVVFTELNGISAEDEDALAAAGIKLNDDNTVTIDNLAPDAEVVLNCEYTVQRADAGTGNAITNVAGVKADPVKPDPTPENPDPDPVVPEEKETETDPTDIEDMYTLIIHYVYAGGAQAAPDVVRQYLAGETFIHYSPSITGYTANYAFLRTEASGMPARNLELTVTYTAIPAPYVPPVEPTPVEPEPDEPPVVPPAPPAPAPVPPAPAPVPVEPDAPVVDIEEEETPLGEGGAVTVDEEGDPVIIPVEDDEIPMADFNEGHRCCILHFLLVLAALIIYAFYTKSMKKRQEKIAELRDKYEAEMVKRNLGTTNGNASV